MIRELYEIIRDYIKEELAKIRSLEKEKRGEYIWDYHKWKLLVTTAVILCSVGLIVQAATYKTTVFNLAIVNQHTDFSKDEDMAEELSNFFGADPGRTKVNVDSSYQIVWGADAGDKADYTDYEKFFLNISHGQIDCAVVPETFLKYCIAEAAAARNITEVMNTNAITDKEIFSVDGVPYGIYVSGGELAEADRIYREMGRYVAFFPQGGKNAECIKKFTGILPELTGGNS